MGCVQRKLVVEIRRYFNDHLSSTSCKGAQRREGFCQIHRCESDKGNNKNRTTAGVGSNRSTDIGSICSRDKVIC